MPKIPSSIVEQVRALAWSGKHQRVVDITSQELSKTYLSVETKIDLLDLRIESYIAQAKLELATQNVQDMLTLAKKEQGKKGLVVKTKALNCQATIHIASRKVHLAIEPIQKALRLAKQTKQDELIAKVLINLSTVQLDSLQEKDAILSTQKAIALFQKSGNISGLGRAYHVLGYYYAQSLSNDKARHALETALKYAVASNDQLSVGNTYNVLSNIFSENIADSIKYSQKAIHAFKEVGYLIRQNMAKGNLSFSYGELGLYFHASRLQEELIETYQDIDSKYSETLSRLNLMQFGLFLGKLDKVYKHINYCEEPIKELNSPILNSYFLFISAQLKVAEGNPNSAIQLLNKLLAFDRKNKLQHEQTEDLSFLGVVYLENKKPALALKTIRKSIRLLKKQAVFPTKALVWWRFVKVLRANNLNNEADEALQQAYKFLLERINNVSDIGLRRNYLNKVENNRNLLKSWLEFGKKIKISKEKLFAHLYLESNTREPFMRLTDTSQRLNALKSVKEIQTFLVEEATELSGGERVMLILEEGKKLQITEAIVPQGEAASDILPKIKKYLDAVRLSRTTQLVLPRKNGLSRIIAPLIAQNQIIGYLYVDMDSIYGLFDETDRNMLGMLANQAAVALDNVSLVTGLEQKVNERTEQLQESVNEAEQLLRESITLSEVGRDISSSLDTTTVLENIATYAKELLGGDLSAIFLPEANGEIYRAIAAVGLTAEEVRNDVIYYGKGILGDVAKKKRAEIINHTNKDPRAIAITGTQIDTNEHLITVPLLIDGELKGLMAVWRIVAGNEFVVDELDLLSKLSLQAVIALKNAQLFSEAEKARAEAEQANKVKSAFLTNMSHELRTPLNAIINFNQLVAMGIMGKVNAEQAEALEHTLNSSKHLLQLINDTLDISNIQAGELSLSIENNVDLYKEISASVSMIEPIITKNKELYKHNVQFIQDIDKNLPLVSCDRRRLKQILINLLTNAVKFTQQGSITLSVKSQQEHVLFAVLDTGSGIPENMQNQIFDAFVQTADGSKQVEGTGLGLPITKSLIEAHQGKLWLESVPEVGSAFFFTIPTNKSR